MNPDAINLEVESLFDVSIFALQKSDNGEEDSFKFAGIAADESRDVEGDAILRKSLDLSYANTRGYVNWNHGKEPGDQLGYLTKASLIEGPKVIEQLSKAFQTEVSSSATIYVEGMLYPYVEKALDVQKIMKSMKNGNLPPHMRGLGLSVEGGIARNTAGAPIKAYIRGVAITPSPVQTKTLVQLRKALVAQPDSPVGLSDEEAILWVLKHQKTWTYDNAAALVRYTRLRKARGA